MNILKRKDGVTSHNRLSKMKLGQIQAHGWMQEQLTRNAAGMGGVLDRLEPEMIATPFINYSRFRRLPHREGDLDPTFCAGWSSEISGTYWTGLVQLAFTLNDPALIRKADEWVAGVLRHQEEDGYLGGYPADTDRHADYNAWGSNWCYRALLSYYEATGREDVLQAVYKGLLWFCDDWSDHWTDYAAPTIIESMIVVYTYTGDRRLVEFCERYLDWLEEHSRWQNSVSILSSDDLPYNSMHVVAYGENVKHPAIVYCATGDKRLLEASIKGVRKAIERIVQVTGSPSSCSEYLSPVGANLETEYCNYSTFQQTYSWLSLITGDASYGDLMEHILFNGAQGARKKDERAIAYFSSPNQIFAARNTSIYTKGDMQVYAPCFYVACCPTQSVRTLPEFIRGMCLTDQEDHVYLLAYGPVNVDSAKASFTVDTLYPFRETITIQVSRSEDAAFHFRIPQWCEQPEIQVNGAKAAYRIVEGGYARLETNPRTGDEIRLRFPMSIRVERVNDGDSASKYPMAVTRGPLVYALRIREKWLPYAGTPITPVPEDWPWYEAVPEDNDRSNHRFKPWFLAMDEELSPDQIRCQEKPVDGYVWENPPVTLEVPLREADFCYSGPAARTYEPWESTVRTNREAEPVELVPYGCTNLRITYFPRAESKA